MIFLILNFLIKYFWQYRISLKSHRMNSLVIFLGSLYLNSIYINRDKEVNLSTLFATILIARCDGDGRHRHGMAIDQQVTGKFNMCNHSIIYFYIQQESGFISSIVTSTCKWKWMELSV